MTPNQAFFFKLLNDFIEGKPTTEIPDDIDWDWLIDRTTHHAFNAVLYLQLRNVLKDNEQYAEVFQNIYKQYRSCIYRTVSQIEDFKTFERKATDKGITFVPMKGTVLRNYWPIPEAREMSDIDIIIHKEDQLKADEIMKEMNLPCISWGAGVWAYLDKPVEFENHVHMFYDKLTLGYDHQTYFDGVWQHLRSAEDLYDWLSEGTTLRIPQESFHLVYLIAHTAMHVMNKGIGLRAYLDIVFFVKKAKGNIDWKWVEEQLKEVKLYDFSLRFFDLCRRWFGVTMPLAKQPVSEKFYEEATNKAIADGTFGVYNKEANKDSLVTKKIINSNEPKWKAALKMTFFGIFPTYNQLRVVKWYSFIDGKPWLLPAAWAYRFYRQLFEDIPYKINKTLTPVIHAKRIEKRQEYLDDWGL